MAETFIGEKPKNKIIGKGKLVLISVVILVIGVSLCGWYLLGNPFSVWQQLWHNITGR